MRKLLTLRWLGITVLAVVLIVACIGLGRWQLGRGLSATGGLQNLGYAGQWWFFGGVVVYGWVRLARDELVGREHGPSKAEQMRARVAAAEQTNRDSWVELARPEAGVATTAGPPPVVSASRATPADDDDPELAAYNDYLARLHHSS